MNNAIQWVAGLAMGASIVGCESSGLSPRSGREDYSKTVYTLYDAPGAATVQSNLSFPAKVGVVMLGEVSPPTTMIDILRRHPEVFTRVEAVPYAMRIEKKAQGVGGQEYTREENKPDFEKMQRIARDLGMDALLIVGLTIDQASGPTALTLLDLPIVGAFVIPSQEIKTEGKASAMLVDLATKRPAMISTTDANSWRLAPSVTTERNKNDQERDVRDLAVKKLAEQVVRDALERKFRR